ncbi:MAG: glycosyltransferase [Methanoregula sp.]|nr:glycosyltransferase [Methanoregula sp.]
MKNKTLLVICHAYKNFQKDQIDELAKYFSKIYVLVRYNPFSEFANFFHNTSIGRFSKKFIIDFSNKPDNVTVFTTPVLYAPVDFQYRTLGEKHLNVVRDVIKKNNIHFDIIHSHFTWSAGYVGARLKQEYGKPLILTAHGYDIYDLPFKDPTWKKSIEFVLNSADHIITVSQRNVNCIRQLDDHTPVSVIPNGFLVNLFFPRNSLECRDVIFLPRNKKILLAVGDLDPVKGYQYLIEAMKIVTEQRKDILCVIVGQGPEGKTLSKMIKAKNISDYFLLTGAKPHNEIPIWINACDLFVLPSLNEGNPTVMFECLGCGKPFIGSDVGGIPEIISSETYGMLSKPADVHALSTNILQALNRKWDHTAILKYSKRFRWHEISKEIIKIYDSFV